MMKKDHFKQQLLLWPQVSFKKGILKYTILFTASTKTLSSLLIMIFHYVIYQMNDYFNMNKNIANYLKLRKRHH